MFAKNPSHNLEYLQLKYFISKINIPATSEITVSKGVKALESKRHAELVEYTKNILFLKQISFM